MIAFENVRKSFDGGKSFALDGVSLTVAEGTFTAVVGGSGSGKTTLLKTVNRLLEIDDGRVLLAGEPVAGKDPPTLRRRIGYVFQGIGLFPHLTVAENIAITPALLGWTPERRRERVTALLDLVRLPQAFAERAPSDLSGGQRQRVGLARALAAEPKVVLLDEPFGALDPITRGELGAEYRALHERLGLTSLMITHDVQEAILLADRIAVMRDGRLVAEGTAADLSRPDVDAYARTLLASPAEQARQVAAKLGGGAGAGA